MTTHAETQAYGGAILSAEQLAGLLKRGYLPIALVPPQAEQLAADALLTPTTRSRLEQARQRLDRLHQRMPSADLRRVIATIDDILAQPPSPPVAQDPGDDL